MQRQRKTTEEIFNQINNMQHFFILYLVLICHKHEARRASRQKSYQSRGACRLIYSRQVWSPFPKIIEPGFNVEHVRLRFEGFAPRRFSVLRILTTDFRSYVCTSNDGDELKKVQGDVTTMVLDVILSSACSVLQMAALPYIIMLVLLLCGHSVLATGPEMMIHHQVPIVPYHVSSCSKLALDRYRFLPTADRNFVQRIDHFSSDQALFNQRYWLNVDYYVGTNGPPTILRMRKSEIKEPQSLMTAVNSSFAQLLC